MRGLIRSFVLSGALLSSAHAFAADAKDANKPAMTPSATKLGVVIPSDEEAYLERLHFANQQEIKLGNLAKEKAAMPQVKQYAEHMVTAHTQADQNLMNYAKSKNISLDQPKPMNDAEQKIMSANQADADALQSLQGQAFDSAYLSNMVKDHDMVLGKLEVGAQQFKGSDVDPMLKKLIPEVRHHRTEAYKLLGETVPKT